MKASGAWTQKSQDGPPRGARIFLGIDFSITLLMGLAAAQGGIALLLKGDPNRLGASFAVIMGIVLITVSGIYFYRAYFVSPLRAARIARMVRQYPDQPWMKRADWAARRVEYSTSFIAIGMWIWVAGWWGFICFIGWVNYAKIIKALSESWWNGVLMSVFVGAGLLGLAFAIKLTLHWHLYGTSVLRIDTLPAQPGETFRGALEANLDPKPRHPLSVELVCEEVLWITSGHGKDRRTRAEVTRLGGSCATVQSSQMVQTGTGVRCPIEIEVPTDLPEYSINEEGNGVRWVLSVNATGDDQTFSCTFDVPIFEARRQQHVAEGKAG